MVDEEKEIEELPCCSIPLLLSAYTWKSEILVTALFPLIQTDVSYDCKPISGHCFYPKSYSSGREKEWLEICLYSKAKLVWYMRGIGTHCRFVSYSCRVLSLFCRWLYTDFPDPCVSTSMATFSPSFLDPQHTRMKSALPRLNPNRLRWSKSALSILTVQDWISLSSKS